MTNTPEFGPSRGKAFAERMPGALNDDSVARKMA